MPSSLQFGSRNAAQDFVSASLAELGHSTQKLRQSPQRRRPDLLLPHEHGAYAQLLFPLASAWLLARPGWNALLWTLACLLGFWAHEPALILLGQRGKVRRQRRGGRARRLGLGLAAAAVAAAAGGLWLGPALPAVSVLPVFGFGLVAGGLTFAGRERSLAGELAAGLALVWAALPVAAAGGAPAAAAVALVLLWSCVMAAGMLSVRGLIARAKRGDRACALAGAYVALAALAPALAFAAAGRLPLRAALALAPITAITLAWLARPPAPRGLRQMGLILVGANLATLVLLAI
jgi:hypothetical protein